jgi:hypothetical protein
MAAVQISFEESFKEACGLNAKEFGWVGMAGITNLNTL